MTTFVEIDVEPGRRSKSGDRYNVFHNGDLLLENCREPLHDGARALLTLGAGLDDTIVMRHDGAVAMRGRLGWCAGHTVSEGQSSGPRFVKWVPYFGPTGKERDDEE